MNLTAGSRIQLDSPYSHMDDPIEYVILLLCNIEYVIFYCCKHGAIEIFRFKNSLGINIFRVVCMLSF